MSERPESARNKHKSHFRIPDREEKAKAIVKKIKELSETTKKLSSIAEVVN